MTGIDYRTPKATWTQKPNGQWRVTKRVKVPSGIDAEGRTTYTPKRISKQFNLEESSKLTTDRKRENAANKWVESLEQADANAAAELERMEAEAEAARIAAKEAMRPSRQSVEAYITSYIDTLEASQSVERHTIRDYRTIARRISDGIGSTAMEDVTTAQVQAWENGMVSEGLAPSTVIKHHRVLNAVFKHAVAVRDISWNPCEAVKVPKKGKPSPNSLTVDGYARLAATLAVLEPTQVVTAATIALYTGAREGEVCGMTWADYDPTARTLKVSRAIGKDGGKTYVKQAKNDSSQDRIIPVNEGLADMLDRRREYMTAELQACGITPDNNEFSHLYIVGYADGRFLSPLWLCKAWREFSAAFGLVGTHGRAVTYHDLRHSFASVTIASGADVRAVAAVLGHANPSITLNTYADALPSAKRAVTDLLQVVTNTRVEPYAELAE